MRKVKRMVEKVLNPETQRKIDKWASKLEKDRLAYAETLDQIKQFEKYYEGTRELNPNPNTQKAVTKLATNVRNISYELIESQVDSSIPMPKVTPIHPEDEWRAKLIEQAIENTMRLLHIKVLNDQQERTVPIVGGAYFLVEWDKNKGFHCNLGGVGVSSKHPSEVIPQAGVLEVEKMDRIFVIEHQTRDYIQNKYGVTVENAKNTDTEHKGSHEEDIVTVNKVYYRNKQGGVGLFSWCDIYILEDMEDYQARKLERCKKCGALKKAEQCECGSKSFEKVDEDYEELSYDVKLHDGGVLSATRLAEEVVEMGDGEEQLVQIPVPVKVPYYNPKCYPLILRKNVSRNNSLLGFSDVEMIQDQQDTIKKLGSKMTEKILKGGSVFIKPRGVQIKTTDEELKVVEVQNAAQAALIDVKNLLADVTTERVVLEQNYDWAKSTLGITDAYQGKYDSSATSGTAKQYSINQAAGRLESKRVMKNEAYANLYELIFKFMLAYADETVPISRKNEKGVYEFTHFNRYDFLKKDAAGEWYWDDEFIFETDPTSTIMMNREAMWAQADFKLQSGAFGPISDLKTMLLYWTFMEQNDYPNAGEIKKHIEKQYQEQQAMLQQMQMGGGVNAMPQM